MNLLGTTFDDLLARGAGLALAGAGAWSVLVVACVVTEACTDGRLRLAHRIGCPAAVQTWLLAATVMLLAGISPATAGDRHPSGRAGAAPTALDGLPVPDRVSDARVRAPAPRSAMTPHPHPVVVVERGDCLWRIARRVLPAGASDRTVAVAVDALYSHNRQTIGPRPDLIEPGQRLAVPARVLADFPGPDPTTPSEAP